MISIPLSATPSQSLEVTLANQNCKIKVAQRGEDMFVDLYVLNVPVVVGQICRDRLNLVHASYLGFVGGLCFVDTQGTDDPEYSGLGSRWLFCYLEASDLL